MKEIRTKTFRFFDDGTGPTFSIVPEGDEPPFFLRLKGNHPEDALAELATWVSDQNRRMRNQQCPHGLRAAECSECIGPY